MCLKTNAIKIRAQAHSSRSHGVSCAYAIDSLIYPVFGPENLAYRCPIGRFPNHVVAGAAVLRKEKKGDVTNLALETIGQFLPFQLFDQELVALPAHWSGEGDRSKVRRPIDLC